MPNPIEIGQFTQKDFDNLGLTPNEIAQSFQPSRGGVFHFKGGEGLGKTCLIAHFYKYLIDIGYYTPYDATGNITFKGKYGIGYTVRKGEKLRDYLWGLTHIPLTHKFVVISEIDSEFPTRAFSDRDQSEIALRMWHVQKLDNIICYDSHIETEEDRGSTDVIFHKSAHYDIYPQGINWQTQQIPYYVVNRLKNFAVSFGIANDVLRSMLIYNRQELTEVTGENDLIRPSKLKALKELGKLTKKQGKKESAGLFNCQPIDMGINEDLEF